MSESDTKYSIDNRVISNPVQDRASGNGLGNEPGVVTQILRRGVRASGKRLLFFLVVLLVLVNGIGIWGILYSSREAQQAVLNDLELQAVAGARSLEAVLASARADFLFLAKSPPIVGFHQAFEGDDLMARRWKRLDIESTLLLFLAARPEIDRISLLSRGLPTIVVGHREGAPVILNPKNADDGFSPDQFFITQWELGDPVAGNHMEVKISTNRLLELANPTQEYRLILSPVNEVESDKTLHSGENTVIVPVHDDSWLPPIDWTIIRSERRAGLIQSLGRLTGRFQITLFFNVLLILLATVLGVLSFRQARKRIALEIENRQQAQIRELERQLMHSERLATVGRLTAGLAHEINNPLEGMSNYLSLLEDDLKSGQYNTCLEFVDKVKEGLKRTAGVTRRALTFAEPGRKPDTLIDLHKVIEETVQFVGNNRIFRNIQVEIHSSNQNARVIGNPVTLGQAFLNLLLNAAEFQSGKGEIEINIGIENEFTKVTIADSGPGIDLEILPRIFEPFQSGRGSTGLGLSICKSIVESHDGRIEAANRPEGGAVFSIYIPLAKNDALRI
jgi:signal transduction histidine kinase